MPSTRHLVLMGGGGFSQEPANHLLDDFILGLTGLRRPRICFISTASGDSEGYLQRFYSAFPPGRAEPSHLPLFNRGNLSPSEILEAQDVIYVGGGNTANMLAIWRLHGVDRLLARAWERGTVIGGISAGMVCWFEGAVTDSFGPLFPLADGLGFVKGSACPHYDGEPGRREAYHRFVGCRQLPGGYAADDGAALHFVGRRLAEVVSSRPHAQAYRVHLKNDAVVETPIPTTYLGAQPKRKGKR